VAQLPLALALPDHASFDAFVAGPNATAVQHVRDVALGRAETLWLWGASGTGKTHLLQAACRAAGSADRRAMYVPLRAASPALLAELEQVDLLALDDVDAVAGDPGWEQPLFGVLNAFLGGTGGLLLAGRVAPRKCTWRLRDLASRAVGAVTYKLATLDDAERLEALQRHAAARGLELESVAAEFLIKRVERDMTVLTAWLDRLDRASLSAKRRLTIPFIREHLEGASSAGE
jgi:DnaA family protein